MFIAQFSFLKKPLYTHNAPGVLLLSCKELQFVCSWSPEAPATYQLHRSEEDPYLWLTVTEVIAAHQP